MFREEEATMTGGLFVRLVSFGRDEIDRKGRTHEPQCQRREKDQFVTKGGREEGDPCLLRAPPP